ncbi:hypothetical protein BKA62DRAFT_723367 [Auriculariales sp. MPI-PUGE-AT-0066]|nr:hypothetical protein BKA62DRAFT_723367 [Auriculariales sp. MPI-PUGE-AT-0066]
MLHQLQVSLDYSFVSPLLEHLDTLETTLAIASGTSPFHMNLPWLVRIQEDSIWPYMQHLVQHASSLPRFLAPAVIAFGHSLPPCLLDPYTYRCLQVLDLNRIHALTVASLLFLTPRLEILTLSEILGDTEESLHVDLPRLRRFRWTRMGWNCTNSNLFASILRGSISNLRSLTTPVSNGGAVSALRTVCNQIVHLSLCSSWMYEYGPYGDRIDQDPSPRALNRNAMLEVVRACPQVRHLELAFAPP